MTDFKEQLKEARLHTANFSRIALLLEEIVDLNARLSDMASENESLHKEVKELVGRTMTDAKLDELDLDELGLIARLATQEQWHVFRAGVDTGSGTFIHEYAEAGRADCEYVAAFDPPTVIRMIRMIQGAEFDARWYQTRISNKDHRIRELEAKLDKTLLHRANANMSVTIERLKEQMTPEQIDAATNGAAEPLLGGKELRDKLAAAEKSEAELLERSRKQIVEHDVLAETIFKLESKLAASEKLTKAWKDSSEAGSHGAYCAGYSRGGTCNCLYGKARAAARKLEEASQ